MWPFVGKYFIAANRVPEMSANGRAFGKYQAGDL